MTNLFINTSAILRQINSLVFQQVPFEDRSGRTPLVALAQALTQLPPDDEMKTKYHWAAGQIMSKVQQMSEEQLGMFLRFTYQSRIPTKDLVEQVRSYLAPGPDSLQEIGKRAEIVRWLMDVGARMWPKELELEVGVKKAFPWLWIEAMIQTDWDIASNTIADRLRGDNSEILELLALLPYLYSRGLIRAEDLISWDQVLGQTGKTQLEAWFQERHMSPPGYKSCLTGDAVIKTSLTKPQVQPSTPPSAKRTSARMAPPLSPKDKEYILASWASSKN